MNLPGEPVHSASALAALRAAHTFDPDTWALICPYSIGDTYFVYALARAFLQRHGGRRVAILGRQAHAELSLLFPGPETRFIGLAEEEVQLLRAVSHADPPTPGTAFVAHPRNYSAFTPDPRAWNPVVTMLEQYLALLSLPRGTPLQMPSVPYSAHVHAHALLEARGLPKGRTVLLAPEAISVPMLPPEFWLELANRLQAVGWAVCLNATAAHPGTKWHGFPVVSVPLGGLQALAETAGWVVSLRSGLCDLLARARCRLSVLYPRFRHGNLTHLQQYGLARQGLRPGAEEYEIANQVDAWRILEGLSGLSQDGPTPRQPG
jgi:hypothetical protein